MQQASGLGFVADEKNPVDAARRAQLFLDHGTATGQYIGWGQANILYASADLAAGRFADAAGRLEQAMAAE